ncbi:sulfite exporter TauE/SafE family protein [Limnobacter humi]|uniref:Sulfite exporter TauE/SafE family protein n=1 Tax=Limnobacter humi TaxID=1778671 RepID=A0ABT1WEV2_9BURK|nr:sulfite exporter TauE/SafE family protein [Limnobacter humi]MCQ8895566.1 sulfite exporter TauE/SafE family protein [Limnobacter humi]
MVSLSLTLSALALGLLSSPHCVTMCACGLARSWMGQPGLAWRYLAGRLVSYSVAGALAGGISMALVQLAWQVSFIFKAFHGMLMAVVAMSAIALVLRGTPLTVQAGSAVIQLSPALARLLKPRPRTGAAAWLAGLAWPLLPCAVLWSALMLAFLGGSPLQGALLMAVFAGVSSVGMQAVARLRQLSATRIPEHSLNRASGVMILLGLALMVGRSMNWVPSPALLQSLGLCW